MWNARRLGLGGGWRVYIRDVYTTSEIDWLLRSLELWCTVLCVYYCHWSCDFLSIGTLEGNSLYSTYVSFPYDSFTNTQKSIPSTTRWPCSVYRTIYTKHTRQKFSRSPWMQGRAARKRTGGRNKWLYILLKQNFAVRVFVYVCVCRWKAVGVCSW